MMTYIVGLITFLIESCCSENSDVESELEEALLGGNRGLDEEEIRDRCGDFRMLNSFD